MFDEFSKIAVAELVLYTPLLFVSLLNSVRHGFSRREGWILLFAFVLIRIVGAALSIVWRTASHPSTTLLIVASILQAFGLSPLLLSTLGFVANIAGAARPTMSQFLRIVRLILVIAFVLAIIAGTKISPDNSASTQATGHSLSKAASALFALAYVSLAIVEGFLWGCRDDISRNRHKLLVSLLLALPFLAVRIIYSLLGAFVHSPSQWSATTGNWRLFLVMGFMMEYIIVCIYSITGATTPLDEDEREHVKSHLVPNFSDLDLPIIGRRRYHRP